ncbi:hypothetical protein AA0Z99_12650 [Agrococcus sp. 1P02AA]|uniref:hypothetical protein n=1 Tax=Agrococcus sp. 1P02AA TaxID=3132259 RepID=UPI0039A4C651
MRHPHHFHDRTRRPGAEGYLHPQHSRGHEHTRDREHGGREHEHRAHEHRQHEQRQQEHRQRGRCDHPRSGGRRRPTLERSILRSARRIRRAGLTPEQLHQRIAATVSHADYVTTMRTLRRIGMELRPGVEPRTER